MGMAATGTWMHPPMCNAGESNGRRRVPMMDGSDHSRHALAHKGSEMGGLRP